MATKAMPTVVGEMKRLLPDPVKRIELDDFAMTHVDRYLESTTAEQFPLQATSATKEQSAERIGQYEEVTKDLQQVVVLLARWGKGDQLQLLETMFSRVADANRETAGLEAWVSLTWYPALFLSYAAGISALASKNHGALAAILTAPTYDDRHGRRGESKAFIVTAIDRITDTRNDYFKLLPGRERRHAARSEHLFERVQPALDGLVYLGRRYEMLFDRFEVLLALVYADLAGRDWVPSGRFAWMHAHDAGSSPLTQVVNEIKREGEQWPLLTHGLFAGSLENATKSGEAVQAHVARLGWY